MSPLFPYTTLFRSQRRKLRISVDGSLRLDAAGLCFALAEVAKAGHFKRIRSGAAVHCPNGVAEGPLTLAAPHDTVNRVTTDVVFRERLPKRLHFGIVKTKRARFLARQRYFLQAVNALQVAAKNIFIPTEDLHASRPRLR